MTKTKRPAEQLVAEIKQELEEGKSVGMVSYASGLYHDVSRRRLSRWLRPARSIDARMRLDGSKLNKRKSAGRKRVTK